MLASELTFPSEYESATGILSTPGLLFTPSFMSTSEFMATPGYVKTPGYTETPGYFTQHRIPSAFLSNNSTQKHPPFSISTVPEDYFNVALFPAREFSSEDCNFSNSSQFKDTVAVPTSCMSYKPEKKARYTKFDQGSIEKKQVNPPLKTSTSPTLSSSSYSNTSSSTDSPKNASNSSIKSHACHYCHRSFSRKYDARRHIRIHTGDKPYTCLCCSKGFARSDALRRHIQKELDCYAYSRDSSISKISKASHY
ncbi:hypothetical protein BY458DRAFT_524663 [Sporodiniella umbellata]|nr:hypothetical protein BY458DRAFT_524663 [Sporodiniella umbellata]